MDNELNGLQVQQACESAPKMQIQQTEEKEAVTEEQRGSAVRFRILSAGCFLYALFYTFCLYRNKSGITYPFLIGGTLYFFGYYLKRYGATAAKDRNFLMGAIALIGILNCTTDSGVLVFFNRLAIIVLLGVLLLESFHDSIKWRLGTWGKALMHLMFGSLTQIYRPMEDAYWSNKLREKRKTKTLQQEMQKKKVLYGFIGITLSIPVLFFIVLLLGSADALFYEMICNVWDALFSWSLPDFLTDGEWFRVLWMLVWSFLFLYGVLTYSGKREYIEAAIRVKPLEWDAFIAIAFLSLITVVYCLFCGIQIFGLFLGWMTLPEGYTYASYARQGFFQLVFICFFNICLVLGCLGFFKKNKGLQMLLTLLSGCTYIMVASSAYRMLLYISSYQLTFLRVLVLWALLMIALVLGGVIWFVWHQEFGLFRYLLAVLVVGYIAFAGLHPDYWIAKYNIAQYVQGENSDLWYVLNNLSLDAAPAVYALDNSDYLPEREKDAERLLQRYDERIDMETENMHIRNWNMSKAYAEIVRTRSR